ncbi:ABC transporter transmembrane domain-containing protein [Bacillus sp. Marseille-P3800]|uniref:ABC transporter transmembrane domain-containing protein n=1 Tax=Bacillus sp. Marseille-P3800 TaxID=2014782 RepID=UPI000C079BDF|nr:ABC transporter transmembrane domain-containing protein [Bacillus sp. Marseille-P3800]
MRIFIDLAWFFKTHWKAYVGGSLILAIVSLLSLVPPQIIGRVVDFIQTDTLTQTILIRYIAIILIIGLLLYVLRFLWRLLIYGASFKLARQLRNQLYHHYTTMPISFYQKRSTGDLMAISTNDVRAVQATAGEGVLTIVDAVLLGGMVIGTMALTLSWELTLITLIPLPLMAILTNLYGAMLHKRFGSAQAAFSSLNQTVQENINGMKVTKAFGQEEEENQKFQNESAMVVEKNIRVAKVDALFDPTITGVIGLCYLLAVSFGATFVIDETMTLGQLTTFVFYLGLLIWPMLALGMFFNVMERGRASYERIMALLHTESSLQPVKQPVKQTLTGEIDVSIDTFQYETAAKRTLEHIYFQVKQGETIALVGKTGSGKSTLMSLLQREVDVSTGSINFDGIESKELHPVCIKELFGFVPQDHFLFSATIAENVAFTNPSASFSDIVSACQLACVHDDISCFPEGYETIVGERGVTLSGGQKQRISIARAILSQPNVLLLDDSLSAVDAKTEEAILSGLKEKQANQGLIMSAHRLSAVSHADLILVLDEGTIKQRGTHRTLMEQGGWYKEMYERQQLESIVEQGG